MADARTFGTVDRETRLSDRVATQVLETIRARQMRAGDRLPTERELAVQFGVSRTVVREAVRSLVGKGVIEARAGRGLSVAAVDASVVWESMSLMLGHSAVVDYRKVHEVRTLLEVGVAKLAAERADAREVAEMASLLDQMRIVLADSDAASEADLEFHRSLTRATHNELFTVMLEAIQDPMIDIRHTTFALPGRAQAAYEQHVAIFEEVRRRKPKAAGVAMRAHLIDVERVWEQIESRKASTD